MMEKRVLLKAVLNVGVCVGEGVGRRGEGVGVVFTDCSKAVSSAIYMAF